MTKQYPVVKYGVAAVSDVLSLFGIPTATAMTLYQEILDKRSAEALDILMFEIRQGNFENIDQDEVVSIIARFQRDAMEGVARNNLKLMARVINGMAVEQELKSSTFYRYANIIASLSTDEMTVLGVMAKHKDNVRGPQVAPSPTKDRLLLSDPEEEELARAVPHYPAVQQALIRTGLIFFSVSATAGDNVAMDMGDFSDSDSGSVDLDIKSKVQFTPTPLMREILKYIPHFDLEAV